MNCERRWAAVAVVSVSCCRAVSAAEAEALGVELTTLDKVLGTSDFVSLHLPLSSNTRGLVGAREIGLMKPEAYLINTARGPIVDQRALTEALKANRIAGAGLDVFEIEPIAPDDPLLALDNVCRSACHDGVQDGWPRVL